jgi:hypothetical protein|uniref:Uncharacterized protein n=4 Tax=Oryza TaxID=4527 RepID=Q2F941_ORYSJ|nr:hypothetical protein OrrupM_p23 [Oryza rufipogon]YP_514641.1 hypothetical protein OrsaiPp12 [Oryza sativa Indica Group]AAZ99312.1 hypothetical protein [Oryza sativa Japonica Group]QBE89891.1 hypothetical protein [Oryza sativa]AAZ99258.1 hypothetical protein [Oryza sativa Indica Group]AAZ99365.1 hypothetical protein [Oryza sativa Japonica Group]AER13012.1 hypothetical protein [Oryza sativa Indica Group]
MGLRFDKSIEQEIEDFFASKNLDTVAQSPYIGLIRAVELLEKEGDGPAPANGNDAGSPGPAGSERLSSSGSSVNQPEPLTQDLLADAVTYESPNYLSDAESTNSLGPVTDLASPLDPFSIHPIMDLLMGNYYLAFTNESLSMAVTVVFLLLRVYFLYIWVRAAFPRYRYDQLMGLSDDPKLKD